MRQFKWLGDPNLAWQTERFLELETHRDGHEVWLRPEHADAVEGVRGFPAAP